MKRRSFLAGILGAPMALSQYKMHPKQAEFMASKERGWRVVARQRFPHNFPAGAIIETNDTVEYSFPFKQETVCGNHHARE